MSHSVDIRTVVHQAKLLRDGYRLSDADLVDMALTVLQLHAGYERLRAELVRTAERGTPGPGEWWRFDADEVPRYPTFIHHINHTRIVPE